MTDSQMRAGSMADLRRDSGDWVFVDVGFSRDKKTGGLLLNDREDADELTFNELKAKLCSLATEPSGALNLALEAPLSAAFTSAGNPAGRSMEKGDAGHRYWYEGPGCQVTVSAAYLLRAMLDAGLRREVRLFEGFVSFKSERPKRSHAADVKAMRAVAWALPGADRSVLSPDQLKGSHATRIQSAFEVFGFDCQVPPVIVAHIN